MSRMVQSAIVFGFVCALFVSGADAAQFIYPEKGQSKEQQELDEFQCHKWAVEQTGVDPTKLAEQEVTTAPSGKGDVARGAARGAAIGAVGGAVGGDAGKGAEIGAAAGAAGGAMKKRRRGREQEAAREQEAQQEQASLDTYNRARAVCLEGRGYKVG